MTEHQRQNPDNRPPDDLVEEIRALHARVAELERANTEHRELSEAYRSLVDNSARGLAIIQDGRVVFANRAMVPLTGYSLEEMKAMSADDVQDLVHPEDRDAVWQRHRDRLAGKVLEASDEFRFLRKDGATRWFQFCASRITYQGRSAVQAAYVDVTEQKQMEDLLRETQRRFSDTLAHVQLVALMLDREGLVIFCNDFFLQLTGYRREEVVGQDFFTRFIPADRRERVARVHLGIADRTTYARHYENPILTRAGELRIIRWNNTILRDSEGAVIGAASLGEDITEHQRAENALLRSEARYRKLFSEMSSGCALHEILCDQDDTPIDYVTLEVNRMFETLVGMRSEGIVGRRASEVLPAEELRQWLDIFGPVALTGQSRYYEIYSAVHQRWFEGNAFCPEPGKFAVTFADVTARKRAEEALGRNRAELKAIYEHTPALLCVLDGERRVLYANAAFTDFTGLSEAELRSGRACGVFGCVNALSDPRGCGYGHLCRDCQLRLAMEDTLQSGISHRNIEYHATLERGGVRREVVLLGATALVHAAGRSRLLLCLQDVTERRQAQERIKQREAELLHVSRLSALGEMAAGLAHELNQPLSAILNYGTACIQLASSAAPDVARIARNVEKITGQAERARDVMGRIRAFAQRRRPRLTPVDLNEAVAAAVDLFSWETRQAGVAVDLEPADDLPLVRADIIQIEHVLLNLARNAIEAMHDVAPDSRRLTIRTATGAERTVRVEVSDTGVGLPPQEADHVFDAFFTTKADGLGIGLSISRTIVEMHSGALEARQNAGPGTTFVLVLPALAAGEADGER